MGNNQSVRATHFQRPTPASADPMDEAPEEHHISISNKMVERLVEDATLTGGAEASAAVTPRGDYKDKIFMERLKCIDENHTERAGLTVEELYALAARIDMRTANMVSVEPVCADCKEKVIECYNNFDTPEDNVKCWDAVGAFTACVQEAGARRLIARSRREQAEQARRSRHAARARLDELKDLNVPERDQDRENEEL